MASSSSSITSSSSSTEVTSTIQFLTFPFRRRRKRYTINPPDQTYHVLYLGNVLTIIAKGEECVEKPLLLIWRTYCSRQRAELPMKLTVTRSGLKAETKQQGITEYWSHRITYCLAPLNLPRIFCWIYKHEGKRMKPELRCHAVLCKKPSDPCRIAHTLQQYLQAALQEYRREKLCRQNARLNALAVGQSSTGPLRKILLQTGSLNFRPPINRTKSAPRLFAIDEEEEFPEEQQEEYSDDDSIGYRESPIDDDACSSSNSIASSTLPEASLSRQNSTKGENQNQTTEQSNKKEHNEQELQTNGSITVSEISSGHESVPSSIDSDDGLLPADMENQSWKVRRLPESEKQQRERETDAVSEESGYHDIDDDDDDDDEIDYDDNDDESQYDEQVTAL